MSKLQLVSHRIPNSVRMLGTFAVAAFWLLLLSSASHAFDIVRITNNITHDYYPAISGSNVAWTGCDGGTGMNCSGGDWEIYLWDGVTTTNISNKSGADRLDEISGSSLVWESDDGNDKEIYLWDGVTTTQITDNIASDWLPDISGSNVVWQHCEDGTFVIPDICSGGDWEIYLWDGVTTTNISNNSTDDRYPAISGSKVVWSGSDGNDYEIYLWDGVTTTQITDNSTDDVVPAISGLNVVWRGYDGHDEEIYFWDGAATTNISNNSDDDEIPAISGSNVVWMGCEGGIGSDCVGGGYDHEIYLWDGVTITQITNNVTSDWYPDISGSSLVWSHCEDGTFVIPDPCSGGDFEIYLMTISGCGDGTVDPGEECDDNFIAPGDGCDASCHIEPGWTCEGEPSVCTALPVPSISLGGLALLAGLVLGGVAWARRCS